MEKASGWTGATCYHRYEAPGLPGMALRLETLPVRALRLRRSIRPWSRETRGCLHRLALGRTVLPGALTIGHGLQGCVSEQPTRNSTCDHGRRSGDMFLRAEMPVTGGHPSASNGCSGMRPARTQHCPCAATCSRYFEAVSRGMWRVARLADWPPVAPRR